MKISATREALLAQLQAITRVASTRSAVQALAGVQITADGSQVHLHGTDMDIGLRLPLPADVAHPGQAVLPARLLLEIIRAAPGPGVSLELRTGEQDVEILSSGATFHVRTLRLEDFPALPEPGADVALLPAQTLVETVTKVARSASADETRPVLTGIQVWAAETQLRMVATDSYRLSVKETVLETPLEHAFEGNVPARALQELVRLVGQTGAEQIAMSVGRNQVVFEVGGARLSSRLIDGQFPNYRQLMPDAYEHELRMDASELADVIRRISLLAQRNSPLRLAFREGELTVSAETTDVGEAHESLPAPFDGEPLDIGFNPQYLRDGLEAVGEGEVVLKLISALRPGLVQGAGDAGFSYLIMPIRLNG
jgi:DNA polymerase-3 subunit beta